MTTQVIPALYDHYVAHGDQTPPAHVSSHWRSLYASASLTLQTGSFRIEGCGFDLKRPALITRVFSRGVALAHWLALPRQRLAVLRLLPVARRVAKRCGLPFDHAALSQVIAFVTIREHLEAAPRVILNIGDGRGYLSALLWVLYPSAQIVLVDLGKSLLVQAHHLGNAFPRARHRLAAETTTAADFVYCPAEDLEGLHQHIDLAINIASMQEMSESEVARYFAFLRSRLAPNGVFYCSNRVEKRMIGGEISRFEAYPWNSRDRHLVDELTPAYRFGFSWQAWYRQKRGPRLLGIRVPFVCCFDPIRHRVSRLQASDHNPVNGGPDEPQ